MKNFTSIKNWMAFSFLLMGGTAMAQTNLLSNASFEEWSEDKPAHWVSTQQQVMEPFLSLLRLAPVLLLFC